MPTAKSYENMEQVGEPFESEGKMYVRVKGKCPRCGGSGHYSYNPMDGTICFQCRGSGIQAMNVRWYTDAQRANMDRAAEKRAAAKAEKDEARRIKFAARNSLGFGELGYITIVQGDNDKIQEWRTELPEHTIWYNELFGWFIPAGREPANIPDEIYLHVLKWEQVRDEEDKEDLQIRDKEEVRKLVYTMLYGESKSQYQGEKDSWLEHDVIIKRNIAVSSSYGESHMHIMEDAEGNVYVWTTASKSFEEGKTIHLRMKVKDHKEYKGVKQTVVYYCKVK
jgi:hypothetical protein